MGTSRGVHLRRFASIAALLLACAFAEHASAQEPAPPSASGPRQESAATRPETDEGTARRGLILSTDAASPGYTLFAPLTSTTTYLVDLRGQLVHSWPSKYTPGQTVYLLDDGSLLRCAREPRNRHFGGGGIGGRVERIAPDGQLLWEFVYADEHHCLHHDIEPLPNGHVLLIAWEKKTRDQALAAGRDPDEMPGSEMWPDCVIEVEPEGTSGGRVVWEWHVWDHLVQDLDESKPSYGVVAEHPELIDLNYSQTAPVLTPADMQRLRSLGYIGGAEPKSTDDQDGGPPPFPPGPGGFDMRADWCHTNAVAYNAQLDQIALSVHNFNEVWIIDHSTSTQQAASHTGGRYGKGGDLLYRWGNPRAYGVGDVKDQTLFAQHDVRWIPDGSPGAGHLTVFNNGAGRPGGWYSSVVEFAPPIDAAGQYRLEPGKAFGPPRPSWEYVAPNKQDLFSHSISGAQRLPNGNTLISSGEQDRVFEVGANGTTVWDYVNPYIEHNGPDDGFGPPGFGPPGGGPPRRRFQETRPGTDAPTTAPATAPATAPGTADTQGPGPRPPRRPPPGGPWPPPRGGPGGPPGGPGPPQSGGLFWATRLAPDHPGLRRLLDASHPPSQ